ncbi:bromodomain-containing protein 7 isoform X2 [Nilaparvata lugens]|nr:bromodomain-containing protein 7 isoform X2 [Nilaparvata lugens]XP_039278370.1 bromodomain-containing protein 7 isoform X2 [Nilaparvata lugens]XP_039278371.1 bromodomain-containing protein 7 isoform X2 [Nilaparvata lugens]
MHSMTSLVSPHSRPGMLALDPLAAAEQRLHKKAKKKKKKKEKDREKKKKHHHKEKRKRPRDESSQEDVSLGEESLPEPPKRLAFGHDMKVSQSSPGHNDSLGGVGSPGREPRLCVQLLRMRQEQKSPLQKLLEHLQRQLEKKDPQQFFAWPVTDQIAPGYSQIILQPMDFSTMKSKIDDQSYATLTEYIDDFKLMCGNAMVYNHPDTIYYKAAKRLLHGGMKIMNLEKIKQLAPSLAFMSQIPRDQLGFDLGEYKMKEEHQEMDIDIKEESQTNIVDNAEDMDQDGPSTPIRKGPNYLPDSKFEAIPDDLTPEEILEQAQKASKMAADKLSLKKPDTKMGFLRQKKDGTTSLAILVPGDGIDTAKNERPVSLGQLVGKLTHGSGTLHGFKEDRRNITKTVKPLYYGAFGSYAPSYDSTFANLTKEESDLVFQTYGDETSVQYAESILNFAKDCDYTLTMVDNLLDLLTGGDHRKTKKILEEKKKFREEEERLRQMMEAKPIPVPPANVKIEISQLKTLSDLGIETDFLDYFERSWKEECMMQDCLDQTSVLLEKLQQVQNDRLSAPPPPHLSNVMQPSDQELQLADKITGSLTELTKQVMPGAVAPVAAIRKAMGIAPQPPPPVQMPPTTTPHSPLQTAAERPTSVCLETSGGSEEVGTSSEDPETGVGVDLESELREFLESDTALNSFPLHDDKTIEEMLSES